jgi:hypothetical protein
MSGEMMSGNESASYDEDTRVNDLVLQGDYRALVQAAIDAAYEVAQKRGSHICKPTPRFEIAHNAARFVFRLDVFAHGKKLCAASEEANTE